jgi:hypothetical protein
MGIGAKPSCGAETEKSSAETDTAIYNNSPPNSMATKLSNNPNTSLVFIS